jgi:excisionase family DNA binding protein
VTAKTTMAGRAAKPPRHPPNAHVGPPAAARPRPPRPRTDNPARYSPLMDARAAGRLLGVPHTWLLAQARAGRIPHHRLGRYVRFKAAELLRWLDRNRSGPPLR